LTQIKEYYVRIKAGDLSCEDKFRPGRRLHVLGKVLCDFLEEFLFVIASLMAQYFIQSKLTSKEILQPELRLQRFSRSWVPHSLSDPEKVDRTAMATDLLNVLHRQASHSFSRIMTEDES
jgi:hypothetical protein